MMSRPDRLASIEAKIFGLAAGFNNWPRQSTSSPRLRPRAFRGFRLGLASVLLTWPRKCAVRPMQNNIGCIHCVVVLVLQVSLCNLVTYEPLQSNCRRKCVGTVVLLALSACVTIHKCIYICGLDLEDLYIYNWPRPRGSGLDLRLGLLKTGAPRRRNHAGR